MKKKDIESNIEYFKKCVNEAIEFFGLHSYRVYIEKEEKLNCDYRACIYTHDLEYLPFADSRVITVSYDYEWMSCSLTLKEELRKTAFHEVLEIMFSKLRDFSNNTKFIVSTREVDSEIHSFIRTFENKLLPLIKESKQEKDQ